MPDKNSAVLPALTGLKLAITIGLAVTLEPATGLAAGFDCAQASLPVEQAICKTPELSALDDQLNHSYHAALGACPPHTAARIARSQQDWLTLQRNSIPPGNTELLKGAYRARLAALDDFTALCSGHPPARRTDWLQVDCSNPEHLLPVQTVCSTQNSPLKSLYAAYTEAGQGMLAACNDSLRWRWEKNGNFNRIVAGCYNAEQCLKDFTTELQSIASMCRTTPATARSSYLVSNASSRYDFQISLTEYCVPPVNNRYPDYTCESPGSVEVRSKGANTLQVITLDNIFVTFVHDRPLTNSAVLYDYQGAINVGDFNFDGQEDFAIQNGNHGSYGGPSYDVFLDSGNHRFVYSARLSELTEASLGFFHFDHKRKRIITFGKSGCCYHIVTEYAWFGKDLRAVKTLEDAIQTTKEGDDIEVVTEKELRNGKWVVVKRKTQPPVP